MAKETFETPYKWYFDIEKYAITHDNYPCEYCRQNLKSKLWRCILLGVDQGINQGINPCRAKEKNVCRLLMDKRYSK